MALAFLLPVKMMAKASSSDNSTLLWYNAPAQQWLEALPIGNSHLGGISDLIMYYNYICCHKSIILSTSGWIIIRTFVAIFFIIIF